MGTHRGPMIFRTRKIIATQGPVSDSNATPALADDPASTGVRRLFPAEGDGVCYAFSYGYSDP